MIKTSRAQVLSLSLIAILIACKEREQNQSPQAKLPEPVEEIRIGVVSSMTGSESFLGIATLNGIEMAVQKKNREGGVDGRKIKIVVADNEGSPEKAAVAAKRLIEKEKVVALIGGVASSRSIEMAPIAQEKNIPMITPASTHPRVTEIGDYIFRVCFIDPFQGPAMARFVWEKLGVRKVAILRDVESEYSRGLASFFKEKFVHLGGQVVAQKGYSSTDIDFKAQLTAIKNSDPELIYLPGYYSEVGHIAKQARALGLNVIFAGGDGWDSEKVFEIAGDALEGSYFTNHYSVEAKEPKLRDFVMAYQKQHGQTPSALSALGYDAASVLMAAMERSKSLEGVDLKTAISKTKDFSGVTGLISIDPNRNAIKPAVILKIEGQKSHFAQLIRP